MGFLLLAFHFDVALENLCSFACLQTLAKIARTQPWDLVIVIRRDCGGYRESSAVM